MSVNYRLRFSRREPAIWLGHLDMMRTFERTVRRAGLPVTWSQGFNPRPHLEFALPIGVGLATDDDYVDVLLTELLDESALVKRLNASFPTGIQILEAKIVPVEASERAKPEGKPSFAQLLMSIPHDIPIKRSRSRVRSVKF